MEKRVFASYDTFLFTKENKEQGNVVKIYFEDGRMAEKQGTVEGRSSATIFDAEGAKIAKGLAAFAKNNRLGWGLCMESKKKVWFERGKTFEGDFVLTQDNDDVIIVQLTDGAIISSS